MCADAATERRRTDFGKDHTPQYVYNHFEFQIAKDFKSDPEPYEFRQPAIRGRESRVSLSSHYWKMRDTSSPEYLVPEVPGAQHEPFPIEDSQPL